MTTNNEIVSTRIITGLTRKTNSRDGGPRYTVHFAGGETAPTKPDAQVNWKITNSEYHNTPVQVVVNLKGQVVAVHEPQ